jgi:hypothetical protein
MLSRRVAGHVYDYHLNFALSSHIQKYEELCGFFTNRTNPNVLDFIWIPMLQMLAPSCQDTYDDVIAQRTLAASKRKPGLFGTSGLLTDIR